MSKNPTEARRGRNVRPRVARVELDRSALARIDRLVARGPDNQCWPWTGTVTTQGYGQLSVGGRYNARSVRAHRAVYEVEYGQIPEGLFVCHRCDNPICCNPAHLFLGTAADNMHDKASKGRAAKGEANGGGGKLTAADVREIRGALRTGQAKAAIGRRFGVSGTFVGYIATGKKWGHLQ